MGRGPEERGQWGRRAEEEAKNGKAVTRVRTIPYGECVYYVLKTTF